MQFRFLGLRTNEVDASLVVLYLNQASLVVDFQFKFFGHLNELFITSFLRADIPYLLRV